MPHFTRILIVCLMILPIWTFYIEVEDKATGRLSQMLGNLKIEHFQRDNKPALMIYGALMRHKHGQPHLTLQDVDIMHQLQIGLYRFQPEMMEPKELKDNNHYMQILVFQSKKRPNWFYRFFFSPQMEQQISQIKEFVNLHQIQPHVDLFQQLPEDLKKQLQLQHEQEIRAFYNKNQQQAKQGQAHDEL